MSRTTTNPLLYNRVCVGEHARISLRDGWRDCARDTSNPAGIIEGILSAVSGHRASVHTGDGYVVVIRRVDVETIEVKLGVAAR